MSDNLMNGNGYVGRASAWHSAGTVIGKAFSLDEALTLRPDLDFHVKKSQLLAPNGDPVNAWGTFRWNKATLDAFKIARETGDSVAKAELAKQGVFLAAVGKDYEPVQLRDAASVADALVAASEGAAHYETLGALGNGETVWAQIRLTDTDIHVGDDVSKASLLVRISHDGKSSILFTQAVERVVCANTLAMALGEGGARVAIRHTKGANSRLQDAKQRLQAARESIKTLGDSFAYLASRRVTRESMTVILDRLFPPTVEATTDGIPQRSTRSANMLSAILERYEYADGNAFPEQRGTAYNLLNAVTEWTDHARGGKYTTQERGQSALFGSGAQLKQSAYEIILNEAKNLPAKSRAVESADVASLGLI